MVLILAGAFYYRCFGQTVCVVKSKIGFSGRMYKIDRLGVERFVQTAKPEKNLKTVYLWQKGDKEGFNRREKAVNKPLQVELRAGVEGKVLSKKGMGAVRITVLGEDKGLYHKLILYINPDEGVEDTEIGGAFARALRWYVGSEEWPHEEEYRLMSRKNSWMNLIL